MLTFQEKIEICSTFPELQRKDVSLGRVNFSYEESQYDKKTVVYHLHPNGNGFVYAGLIEGVQADDKGFVNIRDASREELQSLIERSIRSLGGDGGEQAGPEDAVEESSEETAVEKQSWTDAEGHELTVYYEEELWYVFAGENLDSAFETWEETEEYLLEEGFKRKS